MKIKRISQVKKKHFRKEKTVLRSKKPLKSEKRFWIERNTVFMRKKNDFAEAENSQKIKRRFCIFENDFENRITVLQTEKRF